MLPHFCPCCSLSGQACAQCLADRAAGGMGGGGYEGKKKFVHLNWLLYSNFHLSPEEIFLVLGGGVV